MPGPALGRTGKRHQPVLASTDFNAEMLTEAGHQLADFMLAEASYPAHRHDAGQPQLFGNILGIAESGQHQGQRRDRPAAVQTPQQRRSRRITGIPRLSSAIDSQWR